MEAALSFDTDLDEYDDWHDDVWEGMGKDTVLYAEHQPSISQNMNAKAFLTSIDM